jgi:hypothetical protein
VAIVVVVVAARPVLLVEPSVVLEDDGAVTVGGRVPDVVDGEPSSSPHATSTEASATMETTERVQRMAER